MSKAQFIKEVEALGLTAEAKEYFNKYVNAKRVDKKAREKGEAVKAAIVDFLKANVGQAFDRTQITNAIHNAGTLPEAYTVNEKGDLAFNSITTYANQLVTSGQISKMEVKDGKTKRIKYQA